MTGLAAKRVLVVDDDPETRSWMSGYLADLGYEPHVALDGDHALRSAIALAPEIILLDVFLPNPEFALRFAARYRERVPAERRVPIIAMSASDQLAALAQQIGASDTLAKPFELGALAKLLGKYLDEPAAVPLADAPEQAPAIAPDVAPLPETGPA